MKKSELRNIIRELIKEQANSPSIDYNPNYDFMGASSDFNFPSGFDPDAWAMQWSQMLYSYIPMFLPLDTIRVCRFIANRIQLWTSQYQSAGPLYQNQLVYKIQVAYAILDHLDCNEAVSDNFSMAAMIAQIADELGIDPSTGLPIGLDEQSSITGPLPSNLQKLISKIVDEFSKGLAKRIRANLAKLRRK